ncbi:MAG: GNAT family N-acetyltransferase [Candidatus Pedobacter colombiensis]|uniref:GNAT family N-acetyltransferase n=1 Tax=Candidatus Pedobacter colombiensis TaxID=3121371 RepID=A0AAJ6B7I3_9SPHI|nr:GNAT family N-acetyltransferase [Pedobacter sp.]WEK19879.1 MAG: GNAT family N-acetyltransferase [Pedobacter sp.]
MLEIQIEQIRFDLTWPIRHEAMYPDLPFDSIKLDDDPNGLHFGLYARHQLTAVVSLFNIDNIYQFRKFATKTTEQNKGYGTILLNHIISYVKEMGGQKIWCNARVSALEFYNKFGLIQTGEPYTRNGIEFVTMELQLNN